MATKGVSTTAEALEYDDYLRLIDKLEQEGKYRWELFCILACAFALRASDTLKIRWGDVLNGDLYCVSETKTHKPRRIKINPSVRSKLFYLYDKLGRPEIESPVFISNRTSRPYTIQNVNYHLRNFKRRYKLPIDRFSSHSLRKTFGLKFFKDLGESDRALIILSRELNHSGPDVTRRYIGILESEYQAAYYTIVFNAGRDQKTTQISNSELKHRS